jgi:hypothetical protein
MFFACRQTELRTADLEAHYTAGSFQQLAPSYPLQATGRIAIDSEEQRQNAIRFAGYWLRVFG